MNTGGETNVPVPWPTPARSSQVAQLQRLLGVLWGLAVVGSGVWWHAEPGTAWTVVGALVGVPCAVLALQFGLSVGVSRAAGQCVPWRAALVGAWGRETVTAVKVFVWRQPWRWQAWPDRWVAVPNQAGTPVACGAAGDAVADKAGDAAGHAAGGLPPRGVLLVHGFMCNRGLWNGWHADLAARQHAVVAVNLEPFRGSIDSYVPTIEAAVAALTQHTGRPPLVVAHSMGGLALRAWLRATPGALSRVAHIVTLGTPHQGTWLARWALATNARQMQQASPWLQALARAEPPDLGRHFTCWHSCADNIVFPLGTAVLPGSHGRYLPHVGHVALVDHPQVRAHTLALLAA